MKYFFIILKLIAFLDIILLTFLITKGYLTSFFVILGISIVCLLFILFSIGIELGFREKGAPDDFIVHIKWVVNFFEQKGFEVLNYIESGSSNPTILMGNNDGQKVMIRLNAPLFGNYSTDIIYMPNCWASKKWHLSDFDNEEKQNELIEQLNSEF